MNHIVDCHSPMSLTSKADYYDTKIPFGPALGPQPLPQEVWAKLNAPAKSVWASCCRLEKGEAQGRSEANSAEREDDEADEDVTN